MYDAGERLRQQRLAAARRAYEQDVRFRQLHLRALGAVVEPLVVIVDRHRQHALGIVLSDHIIVQHLAYLMRGRHTVARLHQRGLGLLADDIIAQLHRSEERRGGKVCVSTWWSRWSASD